MRVPSIRVWRPGLAPLAVLMALGLAGSGCGGGGGRAQPRDASDAARAASTVRCGAEGAPEIRALRACGAERASDVEHKRRVAARLSGAALPEAHRVRIQDALSLVSAEQERACLDWNACAISAATFRERADALASRRAEIVRLVGEVERGADAAALLAWAEAVLAAGPFTDPAEAARAARDRAAAERIAALRERQAETAESSVEEVQRRRAAAEAQAASTIASHRQQMRAAVAQFERQAAEHEAFVTLVTQARADLVESDAVVPPGCVDGRASEAFRTLALSGGVTSSQADTLAREISAYCDRFRRWQQPDERARSSIEAYFATLARIQGYMHEIRACRDATGRDAVRCRNTYSSVGNEPAEEATRVLALLAEHERELAGARVGTARFPCTTPVLERISAMRLWVTRTAQAQLPGLAQQADRVCAAIGVDPVGLRQARRDLARHIDQFESHSRSARRQLLESAATMRTQVGED